ncbi:type III-A CRISPR-associated protein Csm2 [Dialister invisus]
MMLEENKIVDQAQQVMEKLCALAKENCEKKFNKYKKGNRKYTQDDVKKYVRENWTSELVTTSQIRKFLTAVNTVTEKVNAYKLEKTDDYDTLPVELQAQIKYLKVKLAYQIGRNRSKWGNPVEDFEKEAGLMSLIDGIKSSTKEYEKFAHYIEALVAFHKFYGGKD